MVAADTLAVSSSSIFNIKFLPCAGEGSLFFPERDSIRDSFWRASFPIDRSAIHFPGISLEGRTLWR